MARRINEPADLRALSYEELDELARDPRLHRRCRSPRTAATSDRTSAPSSSRSPCTGSSSRPPTPSCGTPATRRTCTRSSPAAATASRSCARPAGCPGYPSPRGEPARLRREQPRLDDPVLRLRAGRRPRRRPDDHRHIVAVIGDGSMTGGMAYEALNNLGHSGRRVIIVLNDNGRSYAPTVSNLTAPRDRGGPSRSHLLITDRRLAVARADQHPAQPDVRAPPAAARGVPARRARRRRPGREGRRGVQGRRARVPPAAVVLRGARRALRRSGRRARHRRARARPAQRRRAVGRGADRRPRAHPEGPRLPAAEDDDEKHLHDAPVFDPVTGPPKAVPTGYTQAFAEAIIKEAEPTRGSSRSPRRCPARPACCRSRPASPTASSTSASPSSTPSPAPPAWRWAACVPSSRSTRRSSTGRGTRSSTTSRCTGCR